MNVCLISDIAGLGKSYIGTIFCQVGGRIVSMTTPIIALTREEAQNKLSTLMIQEYPSVDTSTFEYTINTLEILI